MGVQTIRMAAPNLIGIGIDRYGGGECRGRIWHQYSDEPLRFSGVMELLSRLEGLYDTWNFPQSSTRLRTFSGVQASSNRRTIRKAGTRMEAERIQEKHGDRGTFIVRVKYRQNSTWQGEVVWVEREQRQPFRSALELLKLIDSALEEDGEADRDPDSGSWDAV